MTTRATYDDSKEWNGTCPICGTTKLLDSAIKNDFGNTVEFAHVCVYNHKFFTTQTWELTGEYLNDDK